MTTAATAQTHSVRMIDRNGVRGGAAISVVALLAGFAVQWSPIVPIIAAALGIGAAFGLRRSPLGALYRAGKKAFKLSIPVELEEEPPPRFAQTLGFVFLAAGSAFLYAADSAVVGWTLGLLVAALQALLAATGICIGCEMYNLGRRIAKGRA